MPLSTTQYPVSRQECWATQYRTLSSLLTGGLGQLSTTHYPVSRQECWATQYHTLSSPLDRSAGTHSVPHIIQSLDRSAGPTQYQTLSSL
ncbi:hypothetical protein DPMN_101738 [Dreissena polymorpha]|uniref:Uncharacterized protein n=1 Tax=Dreissena polymorpha TaxID=45954 RepID=A0A9D4LJC0_DREPO|nr:hypothetical protein DPMN_101738 [Dreissena polymorpha]